MNEIQICSIELEVVRAVERLLAVDVNRLIETAPIEMPLIEFGDYQGRDRVRPEILILHVERTVKERILLADTFALSITIPVMDLPMYDAETMVYLYGSATTKTIRENPTLGGIVDNVSVARSEFAKPNARHCGDYWLNTTLLRVTVEGGANAGERARLLHND